MNANIENGYDNLKGKIKLIRNKIYHLAVAADNNHNDIKENKDTIEELKKEIDNIEYRMYEAELSIKLLWLCCFSVLCLDIGIILNVLGII